jgi:hypothetical protein
LDALTVTLEGGTDLGDLVWGEGEELSFALEAVRKSGAAVGMAVGAMAVGLAAFSAEADQGTAQDQLGQRGGSVHNICKLSRIQILNASSRS